MEHHGRVECMECRRLWVDIPPIPSALPPCKYMSHCVSAERLCLSPSDPLYAHKTTCGLRYGDTCQFECDTGYRLGFGGIPQITCDIDEIGGTDYMVWDNLPSACEGKLTSECIQQYAYRLIIFHCGITSIMMIWNDTYYFSCRHVFISKLRSNCHCI